MKFIQSLVASVSPTIIGRLLNISKKEWGRVFEAWLIRLLYQIGFVIGWTMLTAMVVNSFGITSLPYLYIVNGILVVFGSLIYTQILSFFTNRTLIIVSSIFAAILLFIGTYLFGNSLIAFLSITLIALSIFFNQVYIMLLRFIEDLFTPRENERANPIIETSEPIGGIIAGILLVVFAGRIPITAFNYFWVFFVLAIVPVMMVFYHRKHKFMKLSTIKEQEQEQELEHVFSGNKIRKGIQHIKAIPFVRGLVIFIFCHWMFVNILNYQYTKAVDANIVHDSHTKIEETYHSDDVENESVYHEQEENTDAHGEVNEQNTTHGQSHEDALTHGLGFLHIIFSLLMLVMQLFFSSRIVHRLGIVNAIKTLPGVSLFTSMTMFFNFNFATAVFAKGAFEMFVVVGNNGYHNSYYAIYEHVREQVREFLEGVIRPLGVIVGTILLIVVQAVVTSTHVDMVLHATLVLLTLIMLSTLQYMKEKYTQIAKKSLDLIGDHPEKFNAIEILSQKGHSNAHMLLTKNLIFRHEPPRTKIKILKSLAILQDIQALPEILSLLKDPDADVRIQACKTLASYKDLGAQFYTQAFAKHRVLTALLEVFQTEESREVKTAIIHVFANIHHEDTVPFLLDKLKKERKDMKDDIIYIIGLFHDINAGYYLERYLTSKDPMVRANTIIALWQFMKYRLKLLEHLTDMLDDEKNIPMLKAGIFVLGEIRATHEVPRLKKYLKSNISEIQMYAAASLAKMGDFHAMDILLKYILSKQVSTSEEARFLMRGMKPEYLKIIHANLEQRIHERVQKHFGTSKELILDTIPMKDLKKLRYYYELLGYDKEIAKIEQVITSKKRVTKETRK